MQRRTLIGSTLSILFASALLAGCEDKAGDAAGGAAPEKKEITLGVTAGSSEEIAEQVAIVAAKKGLTIHVKTFGDYIAVDTALAQGDIDLNAFQHEPYLVNFNAKNNTDLIAIAKTYLAPIAGYSKRWKSVNEVPDGATVTVPNDPTNEGRALYELSRLGWIKLKEGVSTTKLTPSDIIANPKGIKLVELEAALLPRSLDDTDVAIINAGYAISAGLNSQKDSIFVESTETSPYVNIIAARKGTEKDPAYLKAVEAFRSPEIKAFIEKTYKGSIVPSW